MDEAKLTKRRAFETALRAFAIGVGPDGLRRLSLVVTSRITGWRSREDRTLLRQLLDLPDEQELQNAETEELEDLGASPEGAARVQPLRVVTMNVLSTEQVGQLARHILGQNSDEFLAALDADNVWSMVRRPQDVERFARYWQQNGAFGNLTELLEFDILLRLRETDEDRQRDSALTDDQLRKGAEALAAATVFGKTFSILLENEPTGGSDGRVVLPSQELSDWTADQHRDLLTRAIFDPAAYGLVRFHHRSTSEYLAAYWLDRLLGGNLPVSDVLGLFFVRSHGEVVLIASRAAVACWLACRDNLWNLRIREKLLDFSPEALLEHGDGARLDAPSREVLLRKIVERVGAEGSAHIDANDDQLKRLAHGEMAPAISELLLDSATPEEGLLILLRLVREGAIANCVPAALALAANPQSSIHVLVYATAAIASAGSPEEKEQFISGLLARPEIDSRVSRQVALELYPHSLSADALVQLAEKTLRPDRMTSSDFADAAKEMIVEKATEDHLETLLDGLSRLLNERPGIIADDNRTSLLISEKHIWLTPVVRAVTSRLFARKVIGEDLAEKIVDALFLIETSERLEHPYESQKVDLHEPSLAHPGSRRRRTGFRCRDHDPPGNRHW